MFTEHDTRNCETAFVNWLLAVLPTVRFGLAAIHGLVWRRPIFGLARHKFIDLKSLLRRTRTLDFCLSEERTGYYNFFLIFQILIIFKHKPLS